MTIKQHADQMIAEAQKVLIGQTESFELLLCAHLTGGHVLLEGVPGLGKTLAARVLATITQGAFARIQFTPDLMPSDITGTSVFQFDTREFTLRKGPLFANFVLADEINRTPPKTQAALLEAMEERTVTVDGNTMPLPAPFMVVATQNPIEFEGTYPLPEAQLDRFLMKIRIGYPSIEDERTLTRNMLSGFQMGALLEQLQPVLSMRAYASLRQELLSITLSDEIYEYATGLVAATRANARVMLGASPRASIALCQCARTWAAMQGRDFVIPEDVQDIAMPVLRHRVLLTPEAELEGVAADAVISDILKNTAVPR